MTAALTAPDAQILALLIQVCDICKHRGIGSRNDVARVAATFLPRGRSNPRAEAAEREVRALRAQLDRVTHGGERIVELPRRQAQALEQAATGKQQAEIAAELGVCRSNISGLLQRAARNVGADNLATAIVLVRAGTVQIKARSTRRSKAA